MFGFSYFVGSFNKYDDAHSSARALSSARYRAVVDSIMVELSRCQQSSFSLVLVTQ